MARLGLKLLSISVNLLYVQLRWTTEGLVRELTLLMSGPQSPCQLARKHLVES